MRSATNDDRYATLQVDGDFVVYDRENTDEWIQSDLTVDVEGMA